MKKTLWHHIWTAPFHKVEFLEKSNHAYQNNQIARNLRSFESSSREEFLKWRFFWLCNALNGKPVWVVIAFRGLPLRIRHTNAAHELKITMDRVIFFAKILKNSFQFRHNGFVYRFNRNRKLITIAIETKNS